MSIRLLAAGVVCAAVAHGAAPPVPKWTRFETELRAAREHPSPVEVEATAEFRSPSGVMRAVPAFWDGGRTWRVRFTPGEEGKWKWSVRSADKGLARKGEFVCTAPRGEGGVFAQRGPVALSKDRRRFAHADGTPFFWLADTAWNGPLWATDGDWQYYLEKRAGQGFTVVQWVTTQWRGAPQGDSQGKPAYTGAAPIRIDPEFFRRIERKHDAIVRAGLLSVPVMLWAISSPKGSEVNPGVSLSERDAAHLARYMLARWGADPVAWFLNGDGDYRGPKAEKWKTVGRSVFGGVWHAPVSLHPGGMMWVMEEFRGEPWLDIAGYQSAHGDSERNSAWIASGPPAEEWTKKPVRPVLSIEAPYDRATPAGKIAADALVRRNHAWSLLNAPVAGISYGVHGVWGWSDGVNPAPGHGTNVSPHWKKLLDLPGALQTVRLRRVLEEMSWTELAPAPALLAEQPGKERPAAFVSAAQTASRAATVVYAPEGAVKLARAGLPERFAAEWLNPATGARAPAAGREWGGSLAFDAPSSGDWLLLIRAAR